MWNLPFRPSINYILTHGIDCLNAEMFKAYTVTTGSILLPLSGCEKDGVVLANGQVDNHSYLNFGQVNFQKIIKIRCLECFSGEISIKLSFWKCKTDRFSQKKLAT